MEETQVEHTESLGNFVFERGREYWKIQKKIVKRYEKYGRNPSWTYRKDMENTEENSEKIWKLWKKRKSNSEKIWKIQKKIVKRYEKYGRRVGWIVKWYDLENMEEKSDEKWKDMEKDGKKASCIVKWYGKYGRFLC